MKTTQEAMAEVGAAFDELAAEIAAALTKSITPAIRSLHFQLQRWSVEVLEDAPAWRHLRQRWRLRHAPRWTEIYPADEREQPPDG